MPHCGARARPHASAAVHGKEGRPRNLCRGTRLGPYEIVGAVGAGGMSACGRAERWREAPQGGVGPCSHLKKQTLSPCRSPPARGSVRTKSSAPSAPAAWARSTGRATRGSTAPSRSRSCRRRWPAIPQARERFEREARAISALNHPHICTLYDVGQRRRSCISWSWSISKARRSPTRLARGPLPSSRRCASRSRSPTRSTRRIAAGIVHRDLKPGNIMLTTDGREAARLRPGEARGAIGAVTVDSARTAPAPTDRRRHDPRHAAVHGARAARRAARPTRAATSSRSAPCSTRCSRRRAFEGELRRA